MTVAEFVAKLERLQHKDRWLEERYEREPLDCRLTVAKWIELLSASDGSDLFMRTVGDGPDEVYLTPNRVISLRCGVYGEPCYALEWTDLVEQNEPQSAPPSDWLEEGF